MNIARAPVLILRRVTLQSMTYSAVSSPSYTMTVGSMPIASPAEYRLRLSLPRPPELDAMGCASHGR